MSDILPFTVDHPSEQIEDLHRRLRHTRWPEQETVAGTDDPWGQGIPLAFTRELARHWLEDYDWAAAQDRLNRFPQFRTVLGDELSIHFLHARSPEPDALPLVITHGWPGSVVEFQKVIGPLTDPVAHGGDASDAFHVVAPSLPGFGWSDKPAHTGWGVPRIAEAWEELMLRLGYDRFGAQGGDWGAMVTSALGAAHPRHLVGIHLNMAITPPDAEGLEDMTEFEIASLGSIDNYLKREHGYSAQQSTRPQTLGYGLTDSPVGQMAWIVEKFWAWTDVAGDLFDLLTPDELLDNVMSYWLTNSAASSARLYWESFTDVDLREVAVPSGISVFPQEIFRSSRRWAEKRFTDLRHHNVLDRGGHFAAFEQPELFVEEVRAAFRTMR